MNLKKLVIVSLFICFFNTLKAQYAIKINDKAPKIVVTDWIENIPENKSFENNFIVLEFWATWCGPCVKAVPHLNELQKKFNRSDLKFISITDEKVERVQRLLKKVTFNSIVVSDQSKETQIAFGDGKTGLKAYPFTVLIDNSNTIKWIGKPELLTEKIIEDFINNKLESKTFFDKIELSTSNDINSNKSNYEIYEELISTNKLSFAFEFYKNVQNTASSFVAMPTICLYESESLKTIFSSLYNINSNFIKIDESLKNEQFLFLYVNKKKIPFDAVNVILEILNCKKSVIKEKVIVNKVNLINENLLIEAVNEDNGGYSDSGKKVIYTANTINDVIENIASRTKKIYQFSSENINPTKTYDFIMDLTNEKTLQDSFKEYGFEIKTVEETKDFIKIEKNF